jgi:hypothetical protein
MAEPFKKQLVRFYTPEGERCEKDTPGAVRQVVDSRKYYGFVLQQNGKRKQIPLCPDLASSKTLLNKLLADARLLARCPKWPIEFPKRSQPGVR